MKDLELNKIVASILIAGLIAVVAGKITDALYHPVTDNKRGYEIEVAEDSEDSLQPEKAEQIVNIKELLANADAEKGAKVFNKCKSCHTYQKDGPHKLGPNLHNVVGAKTAHHSDYSYSNALSSLNKTWSYEELSNFLKKPKEYAPGTKMTFIGLSKPEDRANIIMFLRQNTDNPPSLP